MAVIFSLTTFWNRTQAYTYASLPRGLMLWYGETYQLLLYEPFLIGMYCWGYTWLRDTRDANDRCVIDCEVDVYEGVVVDSGRLWVGGYDNYHCVYGAAQLVVHDWE